MSGYRDVVTVVCIVRVSAPRPCTLFAFHVLDEFLEDGRKIRFSSEVWLGEDEGPRFDVSNGSSRTTRTYQKPKFHPY